MLYKLVYSCDENKHFQTFNTRWLPTLHETRLSIIIRIKGCVVSKTELVVQKIKLSYPKNAAAVKNHLLLRISALL